MKFVNFSYSDSLGDASMSEGVPKTSTVIKIGFLYDHVSAPKIQSWFTESTTTDVLFF